MASGCPGKTKVFLRLGLQHLNAWQAGKSAAFREQKCAAGVLYAPDRHSMPVQAARSLRRSRLRRAGKRGMDWEVSMAKYYVRCGRVRRVLAGSSRERVAHDVVQGAARSGDGRALPMIALRGLGLVTSISERGFGDEAAMCYPTHIIINRVGPFEQFRYEGEQE